MEAIKDKLLRYLSIDTQANPTSGTTPSNPNIVTLATLLETELNGFSCTTEVGIYTNNGGYFVCAKIPENQIAVDIPIIGFMAYMDTCYNYPYNPVATTLNTVVALKNAYGIDIAKNLVGGNAELTQWVTEGVILSTTPYTMLGIKDKAGIAEIMGLVEYLDENPSIPHGPINICFCCDAELGRAVEKIEDQGTPVQRTRGGLPLWVDPTTKVKSTTYLPGMNPVMGLNGGFMDAQLCYLVDAQSQTHVQYNNYYVYDMVFTFTGTKVPGIYDDEAGINAVKNAVEFASALVTDDITLTVDSGSGFVFIKALNGDYLSATLELEVKDLEQANIDDKVNRIKSILGRMKSGTISNVSYTLTKKYENVRTKIPKSMIGLAVQSIYDKYVLGTMTTPIHHGYTAAQLTLKGVPTVSLSCGAFSYYTPQECVPIPSLKNCFEVLVNIVVNSFTYNFGTDFL